MWYSIIVPFPQSDNVNNELLDLNRQAFTKYAGGDWPNLNVKSVQYLGGEHRGSTQYYFTHDAFVEFQSAIAGYDVFETELPEVDDNDDNYEIPRNLISGLRPGSDSTGER